MDKLEAENQELQMELEESNDRVCFLENCTENLPNLETELTEAKAALTQVRLYRGKDTHHLLRYIQTTKVKAIMLFLLLKPN